MRKRNPPIPQYFCLAVLFLVACSYQVRATIAAFPAFFTPDSAEWPFLATYSHGQARVEFVRENAQAAGLHENDLLMAVKGRPLIGTAVFGEAIAKEKPGDQLEVTVRTPGQAAWRNAIIVLGRSSRGRGWALASVVVLKVVLPFFSILLGFWVAFVRPRDRSAWLLLGVLLGISNLFAPFPESWGPFVRDAAEIYRMIGNTLWPLFMLYFGLYFPEPFPEPATRWYVRTATRVFVPVVITDSIVAIILRVGEMENFASVAALYGLWRHVAFIAEPVAIAATSCFFAFIGTKRGMAVSADAKRRLTMLYCGTTVAMTPAFLLILLNYALGGGELEQRFPEWLVLSSLVLIALFPITLAYVIVVQRALDVRVVVRQGLQYALATRGIRVLQIILSAAALSVAVTLAQDPGRSSLQKIMVIAGVAVVMVSLRRVALRIRAWTDKRFFRDAYHAEQILASLGDEVRSLVERQPLLERVAAKIAEALHVPRVAVLIEVGGCYRTAYALGYENAPAVDLPATAETVQHLRREPEPERVYFEDQQSWINSPALPVDERAKLEVLAPQLLLPLSVKEKLLGIISLGEKKSEEPYSGTDIRLLKSVALQAGLALANAELTSVIAKEVARSAKMNRELEIAREVQERLFPQKLPEVPGLDYCGRCRTALGVGGDYYDFLALPDGKLGVALGDISGKGIAAALLMASLQASLRAEAARAGNDIAAMMARVNQMVYDASAEDRYATLFYAQYDPATRRLAYVNAGHCAPMLFRRSARPCSVERLDQAGGPVVGLMPDCSYQQAEVYLAPCDVVMIYTDGISEAMNGSLEEWGETRVIEAVGSADSLGADRLLARVMHAADAFAAGAPQHDDTTLVILRVRESESVLETRRIQT